MHCSCYVYYHCFIIFPFSILLFPFHPFYLIFIFSLSTSLLYIYPSKTFTYLSFSFIFFHPSTFVSVSPLLLVSYAIIYSFFPLPLLRPMHSLSSFALCLRFLYLISYILLPLQSVLLLHSLPFFRLHFRFSCLTCPHSLDSSTSSLPTFLSSPNPCFIFCVSFFSFSFLSNFTSHRLLILLLTPLPCSLSCFSLH